MILAPPKSDTSEILYDLIRGRVIKERQYPYTAFRDIIARLKNRYRLPLRFVDIEQKNARGKVRRHRKHFLLSIDRKKAAEVYSKINKINRHDGK
jgi:hypothetical protein